MKKDRILLSTIGFVVAIQILFPRDADAYLDPGTGSYILQIVLAAFAGAIYAIKVFWGNIKMFVKALFSGKKEKDVESTKQNKKKVEI